MTDREKDNSVEPLNSEETAFREQLLAAARRTPVPQGLEARLIAELTPVAIRSRWRRPRQLVIGVSVLAAAAGAAFWVGRTRPTRETVLATPEKPSPRLMPRDPSRQSATEIFPDNATTSGRNPCARALVGTGSSPLIDDFEDGNSTIQELDGRMGEWLNITDQNVGKQALYGIQPTLRPDASPKNRYAMRFRGGVFREWGASLEVRLRPQPFNCYDLSAYAGIDFKAKGPGRLYIQFREVGVVPVEYGGTCKHNCYNSHRTHVDLDSGWQRFRLPWANFKQRGYDAPPLDLHKVDSLQFSVQIEDAPFDLWIDDVAFLSR